MSDWQRELDDLERRQRLARAMGGPEKLERQRGAGKDDARARIEALVDPGTFREIGVLAGRGRYEGEDLVGFQPANLIIGHGCVDGRPVAVASDDFTVRGGASDGAIVEKQVYAEQMARELRLPLIRLIDGTGGGGSVRSLEEMGRSYVPALPGFEHSVANLATVPVVSLVLGPAAGYGAARVVMSHHSVMVSGIGQVFVAGPPVVAGVGELVTKEELGGVAIHGSNGTVDDVVDDEQEAFERTRRFLSYLPRSVFELPERGPATDDPARREDFLATVIPRDPRRVYKIRPILEAVVDRGTFFEVGGGYGRSLVTGLARVDGWPVAVLANDPYFYGGSWDDHAAEKAIRMVDLADTFHLPVVNFVDNPGFMIGTSGERAAAIRHGMRALTAIYQATTPWCSIILRKMFGVGGAGQSHHRRLQLRFAWPSADWGSLPESGGIEAAYRAELEAADDPASLLDEIRTRLAPMTNPFRAAEAFDIQDIIDPSETRPRLCEFVALSAAVRTTGPTARGLRP